MQLRLIRWFLRKFTVVIVVMHTIIDPVTIQGSVRVGWERSLHEGPIMRPSAALACAYYPIDHSRKCSTGDAGGNREGRRSAHREQKRRKIRQISFSINAFGPDLGISVGVFTLPEVVWNRNLGFSRPTATRPSLPIFHGEARKPGQHPSPHRSTTPLPCVGL